MNDKLSRKFNAKKMSLSKRRGAAAAEAALMLPLLIVVTFGSIDIAQYVNSGQVIANASREGARVASRNDTETVEEVEDSILNYLANSIPQLAQDELAASVDIDIRRADENHSPIPEGELSSLESGEAISILIEFDFAAIRWLRGPQYGTHRIETFCRRD